MKIQVRKRLSFALLVLLVSSLAAAEPLQVPLTAKLNLYFKDFFGRDVVSAYEPSPRNYSDKIPRELAYLRIRDWICRATVEMGARYDLARTGFLRHPGIYLACLPEIYREMDRSLEDTFETSLMLHVQNNADWLSELMHVVESGRDQLRDVRFSRENLRPEVEAVRLFEYPTLEVNPVYDRLMPKFKVLVRGDAMVTIDFAEGAKPTDYAFESWVGPERRRSTGIKGWCERRLRAAFPR